MTTIARPGDRASDVCSHEEVVIATTGPGPSWSSLTRAVPFRGKLPLAARQVGGLILRDAPVWEPIGRVAVYAHRSSADRRSGTDPSQVVTEVGSALNARRRCFLARLRDPGVQVIGGEHQDHFCRFGAEEIEATPAAQGRRLLAVDLSEVDDDRPEGTGTLTALWARRSS